MCTKSYKTLFIGFGILKNCVLNTTVNQEVAELETITTSQNAKNSTFTRDACHL